MVKKPRSLEATATKSIAHALCASGRPSGRASGRPSGRASGRASACASGRASGSLTLSCGQLPGVQNFGNFGNFVCTLAIGSLGSDLAASAEVPADHNCGIAVVKNGSYTHTTKIIFLKSEAWPCYNSVIQRRQYAHDI